jgi:hypothetical protein
VRDDVRASLLAAMLAAAGVAMSAAPAAVKPTMQVGDAWTFRTSGGPAPPNEWTEQVLEVLDGGRYRARIVPHALPFVEFDGPGNMLQPAPWPSLQMLQFPLTLGKQYTNVVLVSPGYTHAVEFRVAAVERLKTRVGELDCVRLDGRDTTTASGVIVDSPSTIFYCPAVRNIALRETRIPSVGVVRQELIAYRTATPSSPPSTSPRPTTP